MDNKKWLQRKYPVSFKAIYEYFDRHELYSFKRSTRKIGKLTKDVFHVQQYKKNDLIQFRRSNPVNDYNHPFVECILKCQIGFTDSGYHSFNINENDFIEITE